MAARIEYSEKYQDDSFEYRHVILPKDLAKGLPKSRVLTEQEWRGLGVQQSRGWMHYAIHRPEPHILLFKRPLGTDPVSGKVDPVLEQEAKKAYQQELADKMDPGTNVAPMAM
ncbi:conserved unknown protein [Ectocarpus siliculosus]|uniref:Cyclin-dependent kinases regulatory subunit n=1 Tax=Ectocarpus siliculosus TaxID=2880 RepID=D7G7T5_ECTSI|nr:conserved unknown protein [Ectocarpus siliculosus]|eukprot:CBJ27816.1 conserved unknown protein [Ectocarpus siliculosus]